ncbi:hypothetical protein VL20_1195 [Microcystis panniformis FACHB-1757]|uniref:Uncharacterized protein n=2 Tax=Microcystis TaxID=1125 RepID=A0A0A1VPD5_MICAE|nr:hypothetical protein VL20_1195 [Microcystis panniformis FACHB-1757]GAL91424.1 hypothetical protein N44_00793 [Microcystis aeruginosa NIES-44]
MRSHPLEFSLFYPEFPHNNHVETLSPTPKPPTSARRTG